jgi:superfamily II DNA or RNA helicase
MQSLFDRVREAASAGVWSKAVQLARRQAVVVEERSAAEIALRVASGRAPTTVYLHPQLDEWECECDATDDVCEHVAAAVIALRREVDEGAALPEQARVQIRIGYRFSAAERTLEIARVLIQGDTERPLPHSIAAAQSGADHAIEVRGYDLRVEETLALRGGGHLHSGLVRRLLSALVDCDQVRLDGAPIEISTQSLLPVAVVEERGDGFVLSLRRDPAVTRPFANGAALCGSVLRPLGEARLTQREREQWTHGRYYAPAELTDLVGEILPSLEKRIPVDVRSTRLRPARALPPRIEVSTERRGDALCVRGDIVYGEPAIARVDGGALLPLGGEIPRRDRAGEEQLAGVLARELGIAAGQTLTLAPEAAIALRPKLEQLELTLRGRAHRDYFLAAPLALDLSLAPESFGLGFHTRVDGRAVRLDGRSALAAWSAGSALAALPGGGFAELPADFLHLHGRALADLLAARGDARELPACALPDLARLCGALGEPEPAGFARLRGLLESFAGLPDPVLPADLHAELRSYQQRGVAWLAFLRDAGLGALLADDMGLGKTLQALCALRGRALVVCPTSVLYGWAEQIQRFRPTARICVYHGPGRKLDERADITLTSYALLRIDADALGAVKWNCAVLDEAQAIKNPDSQVARAAYALHAAFRLTLTGTPVENRLEELWSQLHFLNRDLLGSRTHFEERYARPIAAGEPGVAAELRERLRPFVLRRLKSEVAPELPPRTEAVLHCELSDAERAVYDTVRAATRSDIVARLQSGEGSVLEALEALLRLRQAACHSALVPGQHAESSTKLEVLGDALAEAVAEGHKALVFSQWTSFLDLVEPALRARELAYTRLDGSTRDRGAVVESFQAPEGPPVLLISLRAGGTGLNLTAADHVFLLDPWWNPAVEAQAADRAHRIGQERPVFVYRLVALGTVEERILALQESKRELAQAALAGTDRATSITREELLALLE